MKHLILLVIMMVISIISPYSYAEDAPTAAIENINLDEGFLTTIYDISYSFDNFTKVYDSKGQLRSIKQLTSAHHIKLYLRKNVQENAPSRLLDKIIYYSK